MKKYKIGIIGLGYVGLPLAVEFSKKHKTIGFDIDKERISSLLNGHDRTLEISKSDLIKALAIDDLENFQKGLYLTHNLKDLRSCNFYIVTVPTPTDKNNRPLLAPLQKASESVGKVLKKGDIVVFESTVYPGVTEEECMPILEEVSGLEYNKDFFLGYSPERINPGDKTHTVKNILKVTSGSTEEKAKEIDKVYKSIIEAGTYLAQSIKVAEAAKVIENSQRDINIAFVNELAKIFNKLGIDTQSVLEAAGTKWNFLPFKPGLVGGHCIGVDPYYLAQKAQETGYHPEIILSGRRINDGMGKYIAGEVVKIMIKNSIKILESKILVLGITFKENCPDIRNTKVIDIYTELISYNVKVDVYDPWANNLEVKGQFNFDLQNKITSKYDVIIHAVSHNEFTKLNLNNFLNPNGFTYDVKGTLPKEMADFRL